MKLWYAKPARQWCEALPVGNGRLGGMVYGGCTHELIKLNEDSIWSGKALDRINPDALENLPKIRKLLHGGRIEEAERLAMCALSGVPDSQRAYQPAGELTLDMLGLGEVTAYRRELDLKEGIAKVAFVSKDTRYTREVFSSYPDGVLAVRMEAEGREGISFDCRLGRCHNWTDEVGRERDTLWFTSGCGEDGISFCCLLYTSAQGNLMIAYHAEDALEHHLRCDGIHRVHFNIHGEPVFDLSAKRDLDPALSQVEMEVTVG